MADNKKGTWVKVGAVLEREKNEDGSHGGFYIKFSEKFTDNKGNSHSVDFGPGKYLNLVDPRKSLDAAVVAGRMDQEKADYLKSKIEDFVKFEVYYVKK